MKQCQICHKGSVIRGKRKLLRGHYNPVNTSRKYPNLQWADVDGQKMKICTACKRTIANKGLASAKKGASRNSR